ncbi:hypothetical protein SCG7086_AB_00050 [Chlamydiales bacterium SCGC AG-110-P3]|nr:hypothetical protein SCG7086_AB_00050 [Chlamydiales bacterium SCGC AG-110-P3]
MHAIQLPLELINRIENFAAVPPDLVPIVQEDEDCIKLLESATRDFLDSFDFDKIVLVFDRIADRTADRNEFKILYKQRALLNVLKSAYLLLTNTHEAPESLSTVIKITGRVKDLFNSSVVELYYPHLLEVMSSLNKERDSMPFLTAVGFYEFKLFYGDLINSIKTLETDELIDLKTFHQKRKALRCIKSLYYSAVFCGRFKNVKPMYEYMNRLSKLLGKVKDFMQNTAAERGSKGSALCFLLPDQLKNIIKESLKKLEYNEADMSDSQ